MAVQSPTHSAAHFGDLALGRRRHVCAVFDSAEDARLTLVRFTIDSLLRAEQVILLVEDPGAQIAAIDPEAPSVGLDVFGAVTSGRLDVRPWADAYLDGGAFEAPRMLAYIRRSLRESATMDVTARRLIGDMAWATLAVRGFEELVEYEREINRIAGRPGVTIICAYDASRQSAETIEAVLAAHDAAFVGAGAHAEAYRAPANAIRRASARRRILEAAAALFAEQGVRATGIDALIEAANVAKATFYRQFSSKDALVVAWLQDRGTRWFDDVREAAEAGASTPLEVIPRIFEATAEWLAATDYLGCPYLNTAIELGGPEAEAAKVSREYILEIGAYLRQQARATGRPDADELALALHGLLAGSISLAVATHTTIHAKAAHDAARRLLAIEA
jgi:AcrR family transcriptional regulator